MPEQLRPYDEPRRVEAEIRKVEAEALKLEAEARDLNRTPWERPGTWVALGSAVVALVGGLLAIPSGYFSNRKTIAEQQEKISAQQREISAQAVEAEKTKLALSEAQLAAVRREREQLESRRTEELAQFERNVTIARNRVVQEQHAVRALQEQQARLQREIALAPFTQNLRGLLNLSAEHEKNPPLSFSQEENSYRAAILRSLADLKAEAGRAGPNAGPMVALLRDEVAKASAQPQLAGLLTHALYQATGDEGVRTRLFDVLAQEAFPKKEALLTTPSLPLQLVLGGSYEDRDKALLTCRLMDTVSKSRLGPPEQARRLYALAAQDPKILDLCPAPFVKAVQMNRDLAQAAYLAPETRESPALTPAQHFSSHMGMLIGLSTQAASVCLADLQAKIQHDIVDPLVYHIGGQSGQIVRKPRNLFLNKYDTGWAPSPAPFGFTRDLMRTAEWPQWLAEHKKVVAFWLEPGLDRLAAHPELLKKAVRGVWLEDAEIPER